MPQGLQVFDAAGNLTCDITDRLSRILGIVDIAAGASGNLTNAGFSQGTGYWICVSRTGSGGYFNVVPRFALSGNTLSWVTDGLPTKACRLIYGIR